MPKERYYYLCQAKGGVIYTLSLTKCTCRIFKKIDQLEICCPIKTSVLFVRPLTVLFWTSGGIYLCALSPKHNGFLKFISGATSAELLVASIEDEPYHAEMLATLNVMLSMSSLSMNSAFTALITPVFGWIFRTVTFVSKIL